MLPVRPILITLALTLAAAGCNSQKPAPAAPSLADQLAAAKQVAEDETARCKELEERLLEVRAIRVRQVELGSDQEALDQTDGLIKKLANQSFDARLERDESTNLTPEERELRHRRISNTPD